MYEFVFKSDILIGSRHIDWFAFYDQLIFRSDLLWLFFNFYLQLFSLSYLFVEIFSYFLKFVFVEIGNVIVKFLDRFLVEGE